ncbi:MAG: hypothetical protein V3S33_04600, partial [Gammaproteobacteria bacterium]
MALVLGGVTAQAASIDFGIAAPTAGSIYYLGGINPLNGENIEVDEITGLGTPANSGSTVTCVDCTLDFTSGNFDSKNGNIWDFFGGGSISITGGVDLTGDGDANDVADIAIGTTLLSGTLTSALVIDVGGALFDFKIAAGSFYDVK